MNEEIMTKMGELAVKFGQPVLDVTLFAARVEAAQNIVTGIIFLLFSIASVTWAITRMPRGWIFDSDGDVHPGVLGVVFFGVFVFVGGLSSFITLCSVINWVGLWHPEVYLASKVLF